MHNKVRGRSVLSAVCEIGYFGGLLCAALLSSLAVQAAPLFSEKNSLLAETRCSSLEPAEQSLAEDYVAYADKRIAAIRFVQVDVFDMRNPAENNRFYAFFNRLHVDTRSSVIAPQLLFEVGDTLAPEVIAETERLLRSLPYLGNAKVMVDDVCGDEIALLVETRDIWTTEPTLSLGREGGENKHGFGLQENNIAGTGNSISIEYDKSAERSVVSYGFHSPHLFNSRLKADLGFAETSDGQQSSFALQSPFYSLQTPWAAGIENRDSVEEEKVRYLGEDINAFRHGEEYREIYTGIAVSLQSKMTQRIMLGVTQERDTFEAISGSVGDLPVNENLVYPWVEYRLIENQFAVYQNLNLLHRVEDVSMGADLRVRLGYAGADYGNDYDALRFTLNYSDLLGVGLHHLMKFSFDLSGREYFNRPGASSAKWGGGVDYQYLVGDKHRWYVSFTYHQGSQLPQYEEFTAGGEYGLRGYPLDYQRGDKRYLLTLEKRYISDLHIFNLFRLGAVAYLDFGRAWGAGYPQAGHLSDVGIGLRMGSSKAKVGTVLHLDLAFPLADKNRVDEFQWVMRASRSL